MGNARLIGKICPAASAFSSAPAGPNQPGGAPHLPITLYLRRNVGQRLSGAGINTCPLIAPSQNHAILAFVQEDRYGNGLGLPIHHI